MQERIIDTKGSYGMFLSKEELVELTGHRRKAAQIRSLNAMRIVFALRDTGTVVVLREHVNRQLGLPESRETPVVRKFKINMDAINAKSSPAKK